jgi:hypothetical protein
VSGVCETCGGRGEIGGHVGQIPENFDYVTQPCPDCTPRPLAELPNKEGFQFTAVHTDGSHILCELRRWKEVGPGLVFEVHGEPDVMLSKSVVTGWLPQPEGGR